MAVVSWKPIEAYNPNAYLIALNAKSNPVSNIANTLSGLGDLGIQYADRAKNTLEFQTKLAEQEQKQLVERQNLMGQEFLADHPLFVQSLVDQASSGKAEDLAAARQRIAQLDAPTFIRDHLEKRIEKAQTDALNNQKTLAGIEKDNAAAYNYRMSGDETKTLMGAREQELAARIKELEARTEAFQRGIPPQEVTDIENAKRLEDAKQGLQDAKQKRIMDSLLTNQDYLNAVAAYHRGELTPDQLLAKAHELLPEAKEVFPNTGYLGTLIEKSLNNDPAQLAAASTTETANKSTANALYRGLQQGWSSPYLSFKDALNPEEGDPVGEGLKNILDPNASGADVTKAGSTFRQEVNNALEQIYNKRPELRNADPLTKRFLVNAIVAHATNPANKGKISAWLLKGTSLDQTFFTSAADKAITALDEERNTLDFNAPFIRATLGPQGLAYLDEQAQKLAKIEVQTRQASDFKTAYKQKRQQLFQSFINNTKGLSDEHKQLAQEMWNSFEKPGVTPNFKKYWNINKPAPETGSLTDTQRNTKLTKEIESGRSLTTIPIKDLKLLYTSQPNTPLGQAALEQHRQMLRENKGQAVIEGVKEFLTTKNLDKQKEILPINDLVTGLIQIFRVNDRYIDPTTFIDSFLHDQLTPYRRQRRQAKQLGVTSKTETPYDKKQRETYAQVKQRAQMLKQAFLNTYSYKPF